MSASPGVSTGAQALGLCSRGGASQLNRSLLMHVLAVHVSHPGGPARAMQGHTSTAQPAPEHRGVVCPPGPVLALLCSARQTGYFSSSRGFLGIQIQVCGQTPISRL